MTATPSIERPPAPYSLGRTIVTFSRFPDEQVDLASHGQYRRLFETSRGFVLVEVADLTGNPDEPSIQVMLRVHGSPDVSCLTQQLLPHVRHILGMQHDIEDVRHVLQSDERLAPLDRQLKGLRRVCSPDPLEGLITSILAQQITIRYAGTLRARVAQAFGPACDFDGVTYRAFPGHDVLASQPESAFRELGMTAAKARAIAYASQAAVRGELDLEQLGRASDRAVIEHLVGFRGVGRWTAEWFLINILGRMTVVPAGDLAIRRETGRWLLGGSLPSEGETREIYERYGPLQGYVAYYVLSAYRIGLEPPSVSASM